MNNSFIYVIVASAFVIFVESYSYVYAAPMYGGDPISASNAELTNKIGGDTQNPIVDIKTSSANKAVITSIIPLLLLDDDNEPHIGWAKSYKGGYSVVNSMQQTSDGGYVIAGYTNGFTYSYAYWVIKVDAKGNIEWEKAYDGNGDFAQSIHQTSDGGYVVAGYSWYYGTAGSQDAWILKLDSTGSPIWQNSYGGAGAAQRPLFIQQTMDGGYIVGCEFISSGNYDIWVFKLNGTGNIGWQKLYQSAGDYKIRSIQQTSDGGYVLAGYSEVGDLGSDMLVWKLNENGDISWQRAYGKISTVDLANSVKQTPDGGYVVAGYTDSFGAGGTDVWVVKLDSSGDVIWQKVYGGLLDEEASSIELTSDGGYVVVGSTNSYGAGGSDMWILKLDSNGGALWQKTYGSVADERANSVKQAFDGGYILAGVIDNGLGIWLVKVNENGEITFNPYSGRSVKDSNASQLNTVADLFSMAATSNISYLAMKATNCSVTNTHAQVEQQAP